MMPHRVSFVVVLAAAFLALAGCATSTVDSRIAERRALFESFPFEVREKIAAGRVDLGFSPEMVELALGEPSRRVERRSLDEKREVWYYTRSRPRVSFGFGVGSGHYGRHGGFGTSIGISTGPQAYEDDEMMRVEFQDGEVVAVDVRR